jgi:ATP-dependent Clp protease protease subunit
MNTNLKMRLANKGAGEFRAEANTIWLYDVIASDDDEAMWLGGISPQAFIAKLEGMTGPVTLRINSPGGSVFGAQAMVVAMRSYPDQITAQVDSLAASAASVIAAECATCNMAPGSMLMIHRAWGMAIGNEADMRGTADLLSKIDGQISESYARRSGGEASSFLDLMAAETWFTAQDAIDAGLADGIVAENTQRPKAQWDLSAYAKAPAAEKKADLVTIKLDATDAFTAVENLSELIAADVIKNEIAQRQRMLSARLIATEI